MKIFHLFCVCNYYQTSTPTDMFSIKKKFILFVVDMNVR